MIKINDTVDTTVTDDAKVKDEKNLAIKGGHRATQKATRDDLPPGCQDQNRFRKRYIPTAIWFAASYQNPFVIDDQAAVDALQQIWDAVYDNAIPSYTNVEVGDAVFKLVSNFFFCH